MRNAYQIFVGNPKGKRQHNDLGTDGRTVLKGICKIGLGFGLDLSGSGQGPMMASCKHGNEPSGSIEQEILTRCVYY
jgi:hypothetical protein